MIVYVTRKGIHECIMGGFRDVMVWTDEPHYHHLPIFSMKYNNEQLYIDKGWSAYHDDRGLKAKPLFKQDEQLLQKVWSYIAWSCCPKGVSFENWSEWADTPVPGNHRP